jgi:hypothetical protein
VRQQVDSDTERLDLWHRLANNNVDSFCMQAESGSKTSDSSTDNKYFVPH